MYFQYFIDTNSYTYIICTHKFAPKLMSDVTVASRSANSIYHFKQNTKSWSEYQYLIFGFVTTPGPGIDAIFGRSNSRAFCL